jgi:hypothetical protein
MSGMGLRPIPLIISPLLPVQCVSHLDVRLLALKQGGGFPPISLLS